MVANGISKLDLKRQNRRQVIRLLRSNGPTSRIDIARQIAITKAAVTIITNEMIEQGALYEKGEQIPKGGKLSRGRKKILLDVNPTYKMDMGLVVDGGNLYIGLCTLHGDPVEKHMVSLPSEGTAEDIFQLIEKLYQELLYKNDLTPAQITGLGVCIAPEYREMLGAGEDWSELSSRLAAFAGLPLTFGDVAQGAAIAEYDYWQAESEVPYSDLLLFRCGKQLSCSILLGGEVYKGTHNRAAIMPEKTSLKALTAECQKIFSKEDTPNLWDATGGNAVRLIPILLNEEVSTDAPILSAFENFQKTRLTALTEASEFFDPGRIILLEGEAGYTALLEQLDGSATDLLTSMGFTVSRSHIEGSNLFLAGAALASREFFLNRGGF